MDIGHTPSPAGAVGCRRGRQRLRSRTARGLAVLEVLYTQRRLAPNTNGASPARFEQMTARPREHLEFPLDTFTQKQLVKRTDNSSFVITAAGIDELERGTQGKRRRLAARTGEPSEGPFAAGPRAATARHLTRGGSPYCGSNTR
jgi:hypothetical protein